MNRRWRRRLAFALVAFGVYGAIAARYEYLEKRVVQVEPGLVRGAWQRPWPLERVIERAGIRTIITLTAINTHDPKYVDQLGVVERTGVDWILVPMRGSTATIEQLAAAADLMEDPKRRPVYFHCVAGHHRTNLALAAYRIRHQGWTAEQAWNELEGFAWTRPEEDQDDRRLIEAFARWSLEHPAEERELFDDETQVVVGDDPMDGSAPGRDRNPDRLALGDGQRRDRGSR